MEVFFGQCAAASCMHEMVNAIIVAVIGQWSETVLALHTKSQCGF
ncbi:MAG: hypothetical protein SGI87_13825 [Flavobacteriales bacterium]|nr:hypothetical protein [Flavobacteriales bacterium]